MTNCWTPKAAVVMEEGPCSQEMPARVTGDQGHQVCNLQIQRKKGLYYSSTLSEMVEMVSNIYKEKKKKAPYLVSAARTALNEFANVGEVWRQLQA